MSKTASTEVVARIREFVAEHQAGRLTWEACADALLEAPGTKYREDLTEPAVEACR